MLYLYLSATKMICRVILLTGVFFAILTNASEHEDAWKHFVSRHSSSFASEKESLQRKMNFFSAHDVILEYSKKIGLPYKLEHNKFSLMSEKEKKGYLGDSSQSFNVHSSSVENRTSLSRQTLKSVQDLPVSIDYRTHKCMQLIKNQGACGSCWAFAAITQVEFGHCLRNGNIAVSLSEQELVDCSTANNKNNCKAGSKYDALLYIAKKGIATAASYPYTSGTSKTVGNCRYNATFQVATVSTTNPAAYIKANDTITMMTVLANKGLVTASMNIVNSFFSYKSGIYSEPNCDTKVLGRHSVVIVGYDSSLNGTLSSYWVIRNSWGTDWGMNGYIYVKKGVNICGVESLAVQATVTG